MVENMCDVENNVVMAEKTDEWGEVCVKESREMKWRNISMKVVMKTVAVI